VRRCRRDQTQVQVVALERRLDSLHRYKQLMLLVSERYQVPKVQDKPEPEALAPVVCRKAGHAE
jgi:hypothetical protein